MSCLIERLTTQAIKLSKKSNGRCRHVAFIVRRNKIISWGVNDCESTHTKSNKKYSFIHAEFNCINRFSGDTNELRRCSIFVFRISRDGTSLMFSKPCEDCLQLIKSCNFKSIFYSTEKGICKL